MPDGTTTDTPATSLDAELDLLAARIESIDLQLEAPAVLARAKGWTVDQAADWIHRARHARQRFVEESVALRHARHVETTNTARELAELRRDLARARADLNLARREIVEMRTHIAARHIEAGRRAEETLAQLLPDETFAVVEEIEDLGALEAEHERARALQQTVKGREGAALLRRALGARVELIVARRKTLRVRPEVARG